MDDSKKTFIDDIDLKTFPKECHYKLGDEYVIGEHLTSLTIVLCREYDSATYYYALYDDKSEAWLINKLGTTYVTMGTDEFKVSDVLDALKRLNDTITPIPCPYPHG